MILMRFYFIVLLLMAEIYPSFPAYTAEEVNQTEFLGGVNDIVMDMEVSPEGFLYLATPSRVFRYTSGGEYRLVAGTGDFNFLSKEGVGTQIDISPIKIAFDGNGNLFYLNYTSRYANSIYIGLITPSGYIKKFAGNGQSTYEITPNENVSDAPLPIDEHQTDSLAVDRGNNVYFDSSKYKTIPTENSVGIEAQGPILYRIDPTGAIYPYAGTGEKMSRDGNGYPLTTSFTAIHSLHISSDGSLLVMDHTPNGYLLHTLTSGGRVKTVSIPFDNPDFVELENHGLFGSIDTKQLQLGFWDGKAFYPYRLSFHFMPNIRIGEFPLHLTYDDKSDSLYISIQGRKQIQEPVLSYLWRIRNFKSTVLNSIENWELHTHE